MSSAKIPLDSGFRRNDETRLDQCFDKDVSGRKLSLAGAGWIRMLVWNLLVENFMKMLSLVLNAELEIPDDWEQV